MNSIKYLPSDIGVFTFKEVKLNHLMELRIKNNLIETIYI